MTTSKPKVLYFFDPLCGWCYAFSPVIYKISKDTSDQFDFEAITGGMVVGNRVGPLGEMADYIIGAIERVESLSEVKFGEEYKRNLKSKDYIQDSFPPSVAINIVKDIKPEVVMEFIKKLQHEHHFLAKSYFDIGTYTSILDEMKVSIEDFEGKFNSTKYKTITLEQFQLTKEFGINGFPTVIIEYKDKYYNLLSGYRNYESFKSGLDTFYKQIVESVTP